MQIYVDNKPEFINKNIMRLCADDKLEFASEIPVKKVCIGDVRTFEDVRPDKDQAKKVLEEAAELYGVWDSLNKGQTMNFESLEDEACDLITATCNLLSSFGIFDIRDAMTRCENRNSEKGRFNVSNHHSDD